jgi:ATPase subunit of ABC transporter with duplicated ATPase domains
MTEDTKKIIYSMINVGKIPGSKQVLKDISLSYFHGAKIGVIGLNGSGKSSLMKIMAGVDHEFTGQSVKLAYVDQERDSLDPDKTVFEVISKGRDKLVMGGREINARAYASRFNFCRKRLGIKTDQPSKIKYRQLTR